METNQLLRLSDQATVFISSYLKPIVMPDYIGWILPLPKKYKCVLVVDYSVDKTWDLLPVNPRKKFRRATIIKALKFLLQKGWLEANNEPFEEFSPPLAFDMRNANIVSEDQLISSKKLVDICPEMSIMYDDDTSGITLLDDQEEPKQ